MRVLAPLSIAIALALCSCTQVRRTSAALDDVETYMSARPDSALSVLRGMPQDMLGTSGLRARHALLHSQALDKCYIDLRTDSIIAPAVRYFSRHGSPDYRLKTCYYRARIAENAGDADEAMQWLVRGERFVPKCRDLTAAGRLYSVKSAIYNSLYDFPNAIQNIDKALILYRTDDNVNSEVTAMLDKTTLCLVTKDYSSAEVTLHEIRTKWDWIDTGRKSRWFDAAMTLNRLSNHWDTSALIEECLSEIKDPRRLPLLRLADSFMIIGDLSSANQYLNIYAANNPHKISTKEYLQRKYRLCDLQGDTEGFMAAYKAYVHDLEDATWDIIHSEAGYIEERTNKDTELRTNKLTALFAVIALVFALLFALSLLDSLRKSRLGRKATEAALAELRTEYESLTSMKEYQFFSNLEIQSRLDRCLSIMEGLMKANIVGNFDMKQHYEEQLKLLSNEKGAFVSSIMMHIVIKKPKFIAFLKRYGLSDSEIGLCCMYATGLSGKQISALANATSPQGTYNLSCNIRKKLGNELGRENLGTFLINQYQSLDNG